MPKNTPRRTRKKAERSEYSKVKRGAHAALYATRVLLRDLASGFGWAAYAAGHNRGMGWAEYEDMVARKRQYEERERLRYLKRRKFVETKRIGRKLMVRLTEKGWQKALRDQIRSTRVKCKDGICVVIFDVPESERFVRDTLRRALSECGFNMIQKSVWSTDRDVLKPLCALLQGANLHRWVRIMVGSEVKHHLLQRTYTRLNVSFAQK